MCRPAKEPFSLPKSESRRVSPSAFDSVCFVPRPDRSRSSWVRPPKLALVFSLLVRDGCAYVPPTCPTDCRQCSGDASKRPNQAFDLSQVCEWNEVHGTKRGDFRGGSSHRWEGQLCSMLRALKESFTVLGRVCMGRLKFCKVSDTCVVCSRRQCLSHGSEERAVRNIDDRSTKRTNCWSGTQRYRGGTFLGPTELRHAVGALAAVCLVKFSVKKSRTRTIVGLCLP